MLGGGGNDTISSGSCSAFVFTRGDAGTDILIGNVSHPDGFIMQYGQGLDAVTEFGTSDVLVVSRSVFNLGATMQASDIVNRTSVNFFLTTDRLIFETDTHILWADKDGSGSAFAAKQSRSFKA